jgi:hypothetical protein
MNQFLMPLLADVTVSSGGLGQALIWLVAGVIVVAFAWWVIKGYVPEPIQKYAILVLVLMMVLVLLNFVLSLGGHGFLHW